MKAQDIFIFCGPTISPEEVHSELPDAICFPPIKQGDLISLLYQKKFPVRAIGIIDGFFESVPAVWHKEILYALSQGIAVYGASSMGAIRAAELHAYGMKGVGKIYTAFTTGLIENDDEVTVVHGPESLGYIAFSEALANIRETFQVAQHSNIITESQHQALIKIAESLFYKERTYENILSYSAEFLNDDQRNGFRKWLSGNAINQKKNDAFLLLEAMKQFSSQPQQAQEQNFIFQETLMWSNAAQYQHYKEAIFQKKTQGP